MRNAVASHVDGQQHQQYMALLWQGNNLLPPPSNKLVVHKAHPAAPTLMWSLLVAFSTTKKPFFIRIPTRFRTSSQILPD